MEDTARWTCQTVSSLLDLAIWGKTRGEWGFKNQGGVWDSGFSVAEQSFSSLCVQLCNVYICGCIWMCMHMCDMCMGACEHMCMNVCVCVSMCAGSPLHVCMCMCVEARGQVGSCSSGTVYLYFWDSVLLPWNLPSRVDSLGPRAPVTLPFPSPQHLPCKH